MILDRAELIYIGEHNVDPRSNMLARAAGSGSNWFVVVRFKKLDSSMVMLKKAQMLENLMFLSLLVSHIF